MRHIAALAFLFLLSCGRADVILTDTVNPTRPTTPVGYPGASTFAAPTGFDDFVALGADPTGQVNAEPILRAWWEGGGSKLYIPAGTYLLTYTTETKVGLAVSRNLKIIGAGEGLVTITIGPDETSFPISMITLQGAADVTIQGIKFVGPLLSGLIYYEQITTTIVLGLTVSSATPTNVVVDHVRWERFTQPFLFFGGATTPTTLSVTNCIGGGYGGIGIYRDYSDTHQLILQHSTILYAGIPAAQNPYNGQNVGTAVYIHGNINYRVEGVLFNDDAATIPYTAFKCGGGQDRLRAVTQQVLIDCEFGAKSGVMSLDGWVRATLLRCKFLNADDGTSMVLGGQGMDFLECEFYVTGVLFGANLRYVFEDCSFRKAGLRAAGEGMDIRISGGSTHWTSSVSSPGYILRCDQNSTSRILVEDHDFWSEITADGGSTTAFWIEGGYLRLDRVTFRGNWRNGADAAPVAIGHSANVGGVELDGCTFDIGAKWAVNVDGPNGKTTLRTVGTSWGGAKVNDPNGEWSGS